jgi:glutathione peroxidase
MHHPKYFFALLLGGLSWLSSCLNASKVSAASDNPVITSIPPSALFYNMKAVTLQGDIVSMADFKGKNIIILNVASKCGYTPQYANWQKYYDANKEHTVVLGFPCNQFLGQEPGNAVEIASFCEKNYGVTFPIFEKTDVKGDTQGEIYQWLTDPNKNGWNSDVPSWNFCKYFINKEGKLTHFFGPKIKPDSPEFVAAIK